MDFQGKRLRLMEEMNKFTSLLNEVLPYYTSLLEKNNLASSELSELGEIEYYLIELNAKISEIKRALNHELFGLTMDSYYKNKEKALLGDKMAQKKMEAIRTKLIEAMNSDLHYVWN